MQWRTLAGFRALALAYAVVLYARAEAHYRHPVGGWLVLLVLLAWTAAAPVAYAARRSRGPALGVELALAVGALLATRALDDPARVEAGAQTLPVVWPAAAVIAWALLLGWRGGLAAALCVAAAGVLERGSFAQTTLHNSVLLVLAGVLLGASSTLARGAQRELAASRAAEAALRERERLGRAVHDGTLQVLALVARQTAGSPDPELAGLGRAAAEQERALRTLVSRAPAPRGGGTADLAALLGALAADGVVVAVPAEPVPLAAGRAGELVAAVQAALDNVRHHAGPGARAWVLLEDLGDEVVVTVRDDGAGFAAGRLEDAERQGRLGVRGSIVGRARDLGGTATLTSTPGEGTEVELVVPREAT
ncbi:histidine kinase/DNA gyrase B/HSP90-like ATPase [Motilibacter rhizosphaerae]|uniref:Histidine kinase/DNA gyrase B/HSP90-like ATPase n=1 Tax=Motilibacter rhizosphaerae TaxID=598652 RepID=A0A4Q7NXA8_9ACTN|nr:histidine kinase/DNA gyrase B/HSP90-like ATPase [Motilibacter rhizosphaerae]